MEYKLVGQLKVPQNLDAEKQKLVNEIVQNYLNELSDINAADSKGKARALVGSLVSGASFHPFFNVPYVGTGLGGAMYDAGQGIVEGQKLPEIAKRAGRGFVIGETVGAVPYVGKLASKTKAGQAAGKALDEAAEKFAQTKAYDALMSDIKALNPNKQIAYHGSPYDFEKFSNEAIGTGEGAQAHGYGHYAALNKDVGEGYRSQLSRDYYLNGKKLSNNSKEYDMLDTFENYKTSENPTLQDAKNAYIKQQKKILDNLKNRTDESAELQKKYAQEYIDLADSINLNNLETKAGGQLYKLSIPKKDVMLREKASFVEQPKKVQKAIKDIVKENTDLSDFIDTRTKEDLFNLTKKSVGKNGEKIIKEIFDAELSGNENKIINAWNKWDNFETKNNISRDSFDPNIVYRYLKNYKGRGVESDLYRLLSDESIEKVLQDKGIKGISYNGGIDGEAAVIFNPDDIDIVRKYYNQPSLKDLYNKFINSGAYASALTNP